MKVLSKEVEEVVYKKRRKVEGIQCECCNKIIKADGSYQTKQQRRYFRVLTGHHDWGNDSHESMKFHDICTGCITKYVVTYLDRAKGSEYIEIETMYAFPNYIWDDEDEE